MPLGSLRCGLFVEYYYAEDAPDIHAIVEFSLVQFGGFSVAACRSGFDLNLSPTATLGVSYSGQLAHNLTEGRFTWLF